MKYHFVLVFSLWSLIAYTQNFVEELNTPFTGVRGASINFSDIDGDGDNDLLISGLNIPTQNVITDLFINQGGSFIEETTNNIIDLYGGDAAFSDIDGDGDEDLFLCGRDIWSRSRGRNFSKLYVNHNGDFSEVMNTPFVGVAGGSVAFSDVDGDGDEDLLLTGSNDSLGTLTKPITRLYLNDGGNFTEDLNNYFENVAGGPTAFSDVDLDGDEDVLISGFDSSGELVTKLYLNERGAFSQDINAPFRGGGGSVGFSDIDDDGDEDLLTTGWDNSDEFTRLYVNENGNFILRPNTPFRDVVFSSIEFFDADGDEDEDVIIAGYDTSSMPTTVLYLNTNGTFEEVTSTPFVNVFDGAVGVSDIDNDGDEDVLIIGQDPDVQLVAKLYINGLISSTDVLNTSNAAEVLLFPNPVRSDFTHLKYILSKTGKVTIELTTVDGRLIKSYIVRLAKGENNIQIDLSDIDDSGTYFIHIYDDETILSQAISIIR